ncbi:MULTISPECIES: magnesium/cobalt transporter CorA [Legionella]|uniref:Magnesium transport protein CorA n=1 Tax=Legionella maceachernii TaxID=466 RepID=A0A0W0W433_9GAMM|nr:magnesium/cobalt transporter CorA [Legionella maceachernii]KTD27073.1 magnesium and cobalt transport protein CorA [Legionella maceachernii]SKA04455.1 magnesium transporter [Legionella maceachernii]SUP00265.1 Magnesium transport protein CorA [Legionella maceachernii]
MITAYLSEETLKAYEVQENNLSLLKEAIWIDLVRPTRAEELLLEKQLNINIPTREEMAEIELSSRLYKQKEALFMTASMIAQSSSPDPQHDAVTFIFTKKQLITIRYIEPQAFKLFVSQLHTIDFVHNRAAIVLIELLEATIDRLADILEVIGHRLEEYSKHIFRPHLATEDSEKPNYQDLIQNIGVNADLNTKARECLVTFSRLVPFFGQSAGTELDNEEQARLGTLSKDIGALSDHASFFSSKVNFLLDATLGMINIEQNAIIKIFSVAAVIFLPPTLIASIYGMNFHFIPELNFKWGYFLAIGLMFLSALIPYKYFKRKKWL